MTEDHTAATLTRLILNTFPFSVNGPGPRFVVGVEVRDKAGFSARRTLDAVVFDTWPSKGLQIHGMEIKVSESDLRRELHNPQKFGQFEPLLDRFSIVAPLGVVDLGILPKNWGLYVPTDDGKLRARRKPLPLRAPPRETIDRSFAAAFVRAVVTRSISPQALRAEYDRGYKAGEQMRAAETKGAEQAAAKWKEAIAEFEETSGVAISTWNAGQIGEAVKLVMDGGIQRRIGYSQSVRQLGERLLQLSDELDALSDAYDKGS